MKYLLPILFLVACSTKSNKPASKSHDEITNADFHKERALNKKDVSDFYQGNAAGLGVALQDETLDNLSRDEIGKLSSGGDPLKEISLRCAQRDFDNAYSIASKSFDKYQKIPTYWNLVANCHLEQGSERKALLFYNKAMELKKNYVPALNNIGVMYFRQGQEQKALVAFERASKYGKFSKTPRYNMAKLYLKYGLPDSALPVFKGILNDAPNDVDVLNSVASAYFLDSDYRSALGYYQKIPQENWSRPEIGLNLAWTLKKLGKEKESHDVFDLVDEPKNSALANYYATVRSKIGAAE